MSSRSGGGAFIGALTDLYFKNLIASSLSFSFFSIWASDLGFGFRTGLSSSAGNIHSGCGLSGAFFFFFFRGGSEPGGGSSNSGFITGAAFFDFDFDLDLGAMFRVMFSSQSVKNLSVVKRELAMAGNQKKV